MARRATGTPTSPSPSGGRRSARPGGRRRTSRASGAASATGAGRSSRPARAFARHGAVLPPGGPRAAHGRAHDPAPTAPRSRSPGSCRRSTTARSRGASCSASPARAPTSPGSSTRATRDGDRWVISGQKVWSSMAHGRRPRHAARPHRLRRRRSTPGISWFAFRLDQPGVTVRPLVEITGHALFNEVFLDDAIVDDADLIGGAQQRVGGHADHAHVRARGHRRRRDHERLPARRSEGRLPRAARRRRRRSCGHRGRRARC